MESIGNKADFILFYLLFVFVPSFFLFLVFGFEFSAAVHSMVMVRLVMLPAINVLTSASCLEMDFY